MSQIEVGDQSLRVWVADEPVERQQGLRGIDALPDDIDGMLFVYGAPATASYGMLDVPAPLDIWWFGPDGTLISGTPMTPCPEEPCTSYASPGEIRWALETPAGASKFSPGDQISTVESG